MDGEDSGYDGGGGDIGSSEPADDHTSLSDVEEAASTSEIRAAIDSFYGDGRLDERVAALMRRAHAGDKAAIAAMDAAEATRAMGLHWKSLNIPNGAHHG
jgi:hypothetical protein